MGVSFKIEENVGPVISNVIRSLEDVNKLHDFDPEHDVDFPYDGIRATLEKLDDKVPLIGFSGGPFTLAGYMIEGAPSRELERTKTMIYTNPEA
jgi:uroporphyrinogen decarboxylase